MDMMSSEWPVGIISSVEAMEFHNMKLTPETHPSVGGFPEQKKCS